jgi:hypothetical protein
MYSPDVQFHFAGLLTAKLLLYLDKSQNQRQKAHGSAMLGAVALWRQAFCN